MIDPEDIKHRCLQVRKADHALTVQPSAAGLAYDYILKLEAEVAELRQENAELHGFDSWSEMMSVIEKNKKTEGE